MKERINAIIELHKNGIDQTIFIKLILHSTDGGLSEMNHVVANNLDIETWGILYNRNPLNLDVNAQQLNLFFNYMSEYYGEYIRKSGDKYKVLKSFSNEKRKESNFEFENLTFTVLDCVSNSN